MDWPEYVLMIEVQRERELSTQLTHKALSLNHWRPIVQHGFNTPRVSVSDASQDYYNVRSDTLKLPVRFVFTQDVVLKYVQSVPEVCYLFQPTYYRTT